MAIALIPTPAVDAFVRRELAVTLATRILIAGAFVVVTLSLMFAAIRLVRPLRSLNASLSQRPLWLAAGTLGLFIFVSVLSSQL